MSEDLVKLSKTPGRVPKVSDLAGFKFAWNSRDGKLYGLKDNGNGTYSVVPVGQDVLSVAESDPLFQEWLSTFVASIEKTYLSLTDTPDTYTGKAKSVPIVNDAATGLNFSETILAKLTHMADFPAVYTGQALKMVRVKADETGVEFYTLPDFATNTIKQYLYSTDGNITMRIGVRNGVPVKDITITALGFNGIRNTDWECLEGE